MSIIENYNKALQEIYEHVGFVEDWVVYPLDDRTEYFWDYNKKYGVVDFADSIEELESMEGNSYSNEIYTQRFYEKHIYIGEKYTMIFCDTRIDGQKVFGIFDNSKRCKLDWSER